ncbi:MAG: hydantoinase B/oxoprolinase family protein [bacterium]|nr:hydantoinase B/oxoprolinase family protein [bacterium]
MSAQDVVTLQVMWNRLLAIVEEQARFLMRAAFSTPTREAGDLSAGVFDTQGRMLAQSVTGTPGHVNSMATSVLHFLDEFPIHEMTPGDIFLTNDPWRGTGHLFDFVVVTPVFREDQAVALFACTSHMVDIGGAGMSMAASEVHQEGLFIPIVRLAREGILDSNIMAIIRANSRTPTLIDGDLHSLTACNDRGASRLLDMMQEFGIEDLDRVANYIIDTSRDAMHELISKLPNGTYEHSMRIDGVTEPIDLIASMIVGDSTITVDFEGTSKQSQLSINVPISYTAAYTAFGVRCVVGPDVPNNTGSLEAVKVTAPEGCILNAPYPAAVSLRHIVGQMLPDTVFGCLAQILPDRVPAEGTSSLWNIIVGGTRTSGESFSVMSFHSGGAGARPTSDGLSATAFPSGVGNMPVEVTETISPIVFWRKEFRPDSGGEGQWRGGHGQIVELGSREGNAFTLVSTYERTVHPARGRAGGLPGATGKLYLDDGTPLPPIGATVVAADKRAVLEFPGGGGFGHPADRDPELTARDRAAGLVTIDSNGTRAKREVPPE